MTLAMTMLAMIVPMPAVAAKVKKPHTLKRREDPRLRVVAPYNTKLNRIAGCESTNTWTDNTGNGYYGGLQFTLSTWYSVGGRGMPNQNSELEQKYRAVLVYKRRGSWADWPVCGFV